MTGGLAFASFTVVPVSYETKSTILLLPPASSVGTRGNPYLYLGGLAQAVEVLSARMNTAQIRGPIEDAHPKAEFTIAQDPEATGPILAISVTSSTEQDVRAITDQLLQIAPESLSDMQTQLNVPSTSRIGSILLTPDSKIEPNTKARNRLVIAVVGLGLVLTVLLVGLIDGLILGRIGRRRLDPDRFITQPVGPATAESPAVASATSPARDEQLAHHSPPAAQGDIEPEIDDSRSARPSSRASS